MTFPFKVKTHVDCVILLSAKLYLVCCVVYLCHVTWGISPYIYAGPLSNGHGYTSPLLMSMTKLLCISLRLVIQSTHDLSQYHQVQLVPLKLSTLQMHFLIVLLRKEPETGSPPSYLASTTFKKPVQFFILICINACGCLSGQCTANGH